MIPSLQKDQKYGKFVAYSLLVLILIGNAIFLRFNAFRYFNSYDMGASMAVSWRVFSGQDPYIDFIYKTGPIHLYMKVFFIKLFGFGKAAVLAHLITISSLVTSVTFLISFRRMPVLVAFLVTLLSTTCFYWPISHPWYDQSAHFWGILAVGCLILHLPFQSKRTAFWTGLFCGAAAVVSFMTKTNIGGAYGLVFFLVFAVSKRCAKAIAGYLVGTLLTVLFMLLIIASPRLYVQQALVDFAGTAIPNRFKNLLSISNWLFVNHYSIPVLMVVLIAFTHWIRTKKIFFQEMLILFLGVTFVCIFSVHTSSIIREANIPLWGIQIALAFIYLYAIEKVREGNFGRLLHQISLIILIVLTVCLTALAAVRGFQLKYWQYIKRDPVGVYPIKAEPLRGWLAEKEFGEALDQMVEYINMYVPKNETLLILTDMEIIYPLTERDSYRGVSHKFFLSPPLESTPIPGRQRRQVRENILAYPPDWIVTHIRPSPERPSSFVTGLLSYLDISNFFHSSYVKVEEWGRYALFNKIDKKTK